MSKVKEWMHNKYMRVAVVAGAALPAVMAAAGASGEGAASDAVMDAVTSGLTSAVGTVKTALVVVAGIGIGIFAIRWGIRVVMGFFKSVAK